VSHLAKRMMLIDPEIVRWFLGAALIGMALMAVLYLRARNLSFRAYCLWGLVALLLPGLGPLLVLLAHPGRSRRA